MICPVSVGPIGYCAGAKFTGLAVSVGCIVGFRIPNSLLRRAKELRDEEIILKTAVAGYKIWHGIGLL